MAFACLATADAIAGIFGDEYVESKPPEVRKLIGAGMKARSIPIEIEQVEWVAGKGVSSG